MAQLQLEMDNYSKSRGGLRSREARMEPFQQPREPLVMLHVMLPRSKEPDVSEPRDHNAPVRPRDKEDKKKNGDDGVQGQSDHDRCGTLKDANAAVRASVHESKSKVEPRWHDKKVHGITTKIVETLNSGAHMSSLFKAVLESPRIPSHFQPITDIVPHALPRFRQNSNERPVASSVLLTATILPSLQALHCRL